MDVMLNRLLNINYELTSDFHFFENDPAEKLAYTPNPIPNQEILWIEAHPLLFQDKYEPQTITPTTWNDITLFFPTKNGAFPIDLFAVSFYLLTRFEEYNPHIKKDQHNRVLIQDTIGYQFGFHRKPVVNMLSLALAHQLNQKFPNFTYQKPPYQPITTYDIDIAYQYRGKSLYRFVGSMIKAFLAKDFKKIKNNWKGILRLKHEDCFDRFSVHRKISEIENSKPIHFILTAPFSKYNRNINPNSKSFKKLTHFLKTFSEIGIHPSYYSSEQTTLISREKSKLEKIAEITITKSRQHYLKVQFPTTFEALIQAGIREDYSLGWPDEVGFRLSTTIPIPFFNIHTNSIRPLILVPLIVMDGALYKCCNSIDLCLKTIEDLRQVVIQYGGKFVVLYHNNTIKHLF